MQLVVVAVAAGLLVMAAVIFFFARGDDGDSGPIKKSVSGNVQLTLAGVQNANAGAPATLGDDAASQIMTVVGQYVDRGLVVPVKTGKPATDVSDLFDAGTQAAIQGPDKDVLFESAKPERTGDFKPAAEPVVITALSERPLHKKHQPTAASPCAHSGCAAPLQLPVRFGARCGLTVR